MNSVLKRGHSFISQSHLYSLVVGIYPDKGFVGAEVELVE